MSIAGWETLGWQSRHRAAFAIDPQAGDDLTRARSYAAAQNSPRRADLRRSIRTSARPLSMFRGDLSAPYRNPGRLSRSKCVGIQFGLTPGSTSLAGQPRPSDMKMKRGPGNQRNAWLITHYFRVVTSRMFLGLPKSNSGQITIRLSESGAA